MGTGGLEKASDVMGGSGWWALGWSFAASGSMTVSIRRLYNHGRYSGRVSVHQLLASYRIRHPDI